MEPVKYKKVRQPDHQYLEVLEKILKEGKPAHSGMDEESIEILGHVMRFDMANGFPLITERDLMASSLPENVKSWQPPEQSERPFQMAAKQGLGEIIGFINGARTLDELEKYGNKWWHLWVTKEKTAKRGLKEGDLGPGSYGAAFHDFPMPDGGTFNQFEAIIEQIKYRPELRTHLITPYIPYYMVRLPEQQQKVVVVPCHGLVRFDVDTDNHEMSLVHVQRSIDTPVGLPFNFIHYGALLLMVAQVTGYKAKELVYILDNAHIYKRHVAITRELLKRKPRPYPKLKMDPSIKNLFDFRVEHFSVEEYNPHPPVDMGGTAI